MHVLDHVQAVQDGAVLKVLLSVASRAPDTVPFFGKFEQITVNSASSSLLPSSICGFKINDLIMCAYGHYLREILTIVRKKILAQLQQTFQSSTNRDQPLIGPSSRSLKATQSPKVSVDKETQGFDNYRLMIIFDAYHNECADTLDNQTLVAIPYIPLANLQIHPICIIFLKIFFFLRQARALACQGLALAYSCNSDLPYRPCQSNNYNPVRHFQSGLAKLPLLT